MQDATDRDVLDAIIGVITSGETAFTLKNYIQDTRIEQAEEVIEGQKQRTEALVQEEEQAPNGNEEQGATMDENTPEPSADEDGGMPFGPPLNEGDVPFSVKGNKEGQTPEERSAFVAKNKVENMKLVDDVIGKKLRKALERIAMMSGAKIQWQRTDRKGNGWYDASSNTLYLTLDASITRVCSLSSGTK